MYYKETWCNTKIPLKVSDSSSFPSYTETGAGKKNPNKPPKMQTTNSPKKMETYLNSYEHKHK